MAIQPRIDAYQNDSPRPVPSSEDLPPKPEGEELEHLIAPEWAFDFDVAQVHGIHELRQRIADAAYATDPVAEWSKILKDHIVFGNNKVAPEVAIFNLNSAHDCPNLGTERCQVDKDDCYAVRSEIRQLHPQDYRQRQEIIWAHIDPVTFVKAFRRLRDRKRNEVTTLRFSQSGDYRTQQDILKVDEIARRLEDLDVYTYTASSFLDWSDAEHVTVNASNENFDHADHRFIVVDSAEDIPEGGIRCPYDQSDGEIKCGDCRLCANQNSPDIYYEEF